MSTAFFSLSTTGQPLANADYLKVPVIGPIKRASLSLFNMLHNILQFIMPVYTADCITFLHAQRFVINTSSISAVLRRNFQRL